MSDQSLKGHTALVTGSSKGLGAGIAKSLAAVGAKIVVNAYNNIARGDEVADEIRANGGQALAIRADVSKESEIASLFEQAGNELGPVDIVVPNATPLQPQKPIEEYDEEFYRSMLDFFVMSPFLLAQAAIPGMKEQGWGRIHQHHLRGLFGFGSQFLGLRRRQGWTNRMVTVDGPGTRSFWNHRQYGGSRLDPGGTSCR